MAYTPELSLQSSSTLRRIAWALKLPMTEAIEQVFEHLPGILDRRKVCEACRDRSKCATCAFNPIYKKGTSPCRPEPMLKMCLGLHPLHRPAQGDY